MLAIVLAGLLAAMAPSAFADEGNVSLNVSLVDAPEEGVVCSRRNCFNLSIISNQGDATAIVVDPSCNEVLKVWSDGC